MMRKRRSEEEKGEKKVSGRYERMIEKGV